MADRHREGGAGAAGPRPAGAAGPSGDVHQLFGGMAPEQGIRARGTHASKPEDGSLNLVPSTLWPLLPVGAIISPTNDSNKTFVQNHPPTSTYHVLPADKTQGQNAFRGQRRPR